MLLLRWDTELQRADLVRDGGNLATDEGFESAVTMSLFTDRDAGCWMDAYPDVAGDKLGSFLLRLQRGKLTRQDAADAARYAKEALSWMLADGVAAAVDATAELVSAGLLGLRVSISKPGDIAPAWSGYWEVPFV
jgi:phage gp46-like protein